MRYSKGIIFFLFVTVALAFNSCSSTRINRLEGQWQLFWIDHLDDENIYLWEFANDGTFSILQFTPPTPTTPSSKSVLIRASYESKAQFDKAVIRIYDVQNQHASGFNQLSLLDRETYDADWIILEIDDEVMRIGTDDVNPDGGGFVIREFSRVE